MNKNRNGYWLEYDYKNLGIQVFDTVTVFEENSYEGIKGFFLAFNKMKSESNINTKRFSDVLLYVNIPFNNGNDKTVAILSTNLVVSSTRMVLTEKWI